MKPSKWWTLSFIMFLGQAWLGSLVGWPATQVMLSGIAAIIALATAAILREIGR